MTTKVTAVTLLLVNYTFEGANAMLIEKKLAMTLGRF